MVFWLLCSGGSINECSIFFDILNHLCIIFILGQIAFVPDNYQQAFGTCKSKILLKTFRTKNVDNKLTSDCNVEPFWIEEEILERKVKNSYILVGISNVHRQYRSNRIYIHKLTPALILLGGPRLLPSTPLTRLLLGKRSLDLTVEKIITDFSFPWNFSTQPTST